MKYIVYVANSADSLTKIINEAISLGWKPIGGVSCSQSFETYENHRKGGTDYQTEYTFAQAMVFDSSNTNLSGGCSEPSRSKDLLGENGERK